MVMVGCLLGIMVGIFMRAAFVDTSTHWIVTEDGKLQEQPDSMLSMKRPHDLVAFMHQEERVDSMEQLKTYIAEHQEIVDSTDDKDDGFEERFLATEESCIKAVKRLPEFDLYISTVLPLENKGIRAEDHINLKNPPSTEYSAPYCVSPLDFSVHAFEHLEGVQNRKRLLGTPELGLKSAITQRESEDEYGHLVNEALKLNQTSWVLYNMAAFYWRIKGDPNEAIECLRRAMHHSPGNFKDIAYVSLGNILHRSKYSHEAAIVLEAALDLSSSLNVNHFTLGNIYAVLTEYNRSIACFDNTLLLQPDFDAAEKRRWAVICYSKLEEALEAQHRNLQAALEKLKEYQKKHESMQTLTELVVMEQSSRTNRVTRNSEFTEHKHLRRQEARPVMGEHCEVVSNEDGQAVVCEWKETNMDVNNSHQAIDIERKFSSIPITETELERLRLETDRLKVLEDGSYRDDVVGARQDYSKPIRPPTYAPVESVQIASKPDQPLHLDPDWPTKAECDEKHAKLLAWDEYPTTFLPPENKGFDSRVFLADAIDIETGDEHPLPWYPPVCVNIVDLKQGEMFLDHINAFKQRDQVTLRSTDLNMKKIMLSWVNHGEVEEEEVGQRILTALKQNLAPRWLLYNLAGLYWRVVGNNYHAIECLRRSLHFVPADYVDVPLVNVANIFIKWGQFQDALNMTRQALIFCPFEPITHLTQANILAIVNNETGAIHHYEKALEYDPNFSEALDMLRNLKCYSKYEKEAIIEADKNTCKASNSNRQQNCGSVNIIQNCQTTMSLCANEILPTDSSDDFLSLGAFLRKNKMLDETEANVMKEFHKVNGLCSGVECDHIVHKPGTDPYIKIKVASPGKWIQRLLFIGPEEELGEEEEDECYLLKDKQRKGCANNEFVVNEKRVLQLEKVLAELLQFIEDRHEAGGLTVGEKGVQEKVTIKDGGEVVELDGFVDIVCVSVEDKDQIRCFSKKDATPDQIELPEVMPRQTLKLPSVKFRPADSDCDDYKDIDFKAFTSTWLSVTTRDAAEHMDNPVTIADVSELLSLEEVISVDDKEAPMCEAKFGASVFLFDHLPSIADKEKLKYSTENVLRDIVRVLGGVEESVDVVGSRISRALEKNSSSWVLGCLGALYWRVQGHAPNAINCLKMALMNAPTDRRHIPLLSLANILHKAGAINDALSIALEALESSPETVVIHFSIGNMYAAKGDFSKAIEYYQSTLALQEKFVPARERLIAIMCGNLMHEERDTDEDDNESGGDD